MKKNLVLAGLLSVALPLFAQQVDHECADPHPAPSAPWQSVKQVELGWGTTDLRYQKNEIPALTRKLELYAWRGERVNAQAVLLAPQAIKQLSFAVSDLRCGKEVIPSDAVRPYFVRYVLTDSYLDKSGKENHGAHLTAAFDSFLVADRLDPAPLMTVESQTVRPLWMEIQVPVSALPGKYKGTLTATCDGQSLSLPFTLQVSKRQLPKPTDWAFHLDLWQNPYAVARFHQVPLWSQAHFDLMRPLMEELAAAGQKVITTSIIQHPWNSQTEDPFESMIGKRKAVDGSWSYDYAVFDRWVEFMFSLGIDKQINCYSMIPWALEFDYYDQATSSNTTIQATPGSQEYNEYWGSFIADFARHLKSKGWFEKTMIAMDERPMESMQEVLSLIRNIEPGFKISLAGNYHEPINHEIADFSEGFAPKKEFPESAKARRKELGLTTTIYTCCAEAHPNMFVISDPDEAAWLGWFAQAENYDGYLRWAYNSWTLDPLTDTRFRTWPAGDCFVVYPGGRGSVRFSKLTEGIQDFEKVRILRAQWQKEGNEAKLAQLTEVLKPFTSDKILEEGPAKALAAAKSFLDKQ